MRSSLRTSSVLFARAASVRVPQVIAAGVAASSQAPGPEDPESKPQSNLAARETYRAWRQGSGKYHHHHASPSTARVQSDLIHTLVPRAPCVPRCLLDYDSHNIIGKGGFGIVYAANSKCDGQRYALKIVPSRGISPSSEARCMATLPLHPNLVRYHAAWREEAHSVRELWSALKAASGGKDLEASDDGLESSLESTSDNSGAASLDRVAAGGQSSLVLQMELVSLPTLAAVLRSELAGAGALYAFAAVAQGGGRTHTPGPVSDLMRWRWIAGVASGLRAMHSVGWAHNDVKPANIFCSADGTAKLADFGLATPIGTGQETREPHAARAAEAVGQEERAAAGDSVGRETGQAAEPPRGAQEDEEAEEDRFEAAGTLLYMAPERLQRPSAQAVGAASDVYSLGVTLAEVHGRFGTLMERAQVLGALKEEAAQADVMRDSALNSHRFAGRPPRGGRGGQLGGGVRLPASVPENAPLAAGSRTGLFARSMLATTPEARPRLEAVEIVARDRAIYG